MSFDIPVPDFDLSGFNKMPSSLNKISNGLKSVSKWNSKWAEELNKGSKSEKKWVKGFGQVSDTISGASSMAGELGSGMLNWIGIFLQLADAMGILQPIFDAITMVMQLIGINAIQVMMPALMAFYKMLTDQKTQAMLQQFGTVIGQFFAVVLKIVTDLFGDPNVQKMILVFLKIFTKLLEVLATIIGAFIGFMASLPIPVLLAVFVALATIVAFWWGFSHGGPILGGILAVGTAITLGILSAIVASGMAEGGLAMTPGLRPIAEKGPELVIPMDRLSEVGIGGNDELLWAMEDNNTRLEILIQETRNSNDRRRRYR